MDNHEGSVLHAVVEIELSRLDGIRIEQGEEFYAEGLGESLTNHLFVAGTGGEVGKLASEVVKAIGNRTKEIMDNPDLMLNYVEGIMRELKERRFLSEK